MKKPEVEGRHEYLSVRYPLSSSISVHQIQFLNVLNSSRKTKEKPFSKRMST
jgi:hypothetical protein